LRKPDEGTAADDVVNRCLDLQAQNVPGTDDVSIRNNLIGMLIGAIPTTSKCVVLCIDYLLSHPKLLAGAQAAARADDDVLVNQYVLESLRFNPFGPGLLRYCAQDYVLGAGAWRSTKIAAGTTVFVTLQSAMLDGRKIPSPNEFRLDRPAYSYMHSGYGLHTCSGKYINAVQITGIVKAVLKRKNLRRANGEAGQVQMQGAFPAHLVLEFDR
jgi:cytochrome P450